MLNTTLSIFWLVVLQPLRQTNGTAYPSMEAWRDAKVSSKKQIVTNLITKKLWGSYDEEGQFVELSFESPVVIPFTVKGE